MINNTTYYVADGVYYRKADDKEGYVVAEPPQEAVADQTVVPSEGTLAPDSFDTLRRMNEYVQKLKHFEIRTNVTADEMLDSSQKIQLSSNRTVYVSRPDKIAVEFKDGRDSRRVVYDGKTITMLDRGKNVYASIEMPNTIDAMLDTLAKDYGLTLPWADVIRSDYEGLVAPVQTGQYLGLHMAGGRQCHHLAFTQAAVDWEIWIEAGDKPLPRKLVITYKHQPGSPRYMLTIPRWDISPISPDAFELDLPADAQRIDALPSASVED